MIATEFLSDSFLPHQWALAPKYGIQPVSLFLGNGHYGLEVAVAQCLGTPTRAGLLGAWRSRKGSRAAPLLLVVLHPEGVTVCGAAGSEPPIFTVEDASQVEGLCRQALEQPDRHSALQLLSSTLPSLETALPGLRNEGLLAMHEVQHGVPKRQDWETAGRKGARVRGKRNDGLLSALGFQIERLDNLTGLLRSGNRRTALAIMLHDSESPEGRSGRFDPLSPVSYALKKADDENLEWVVLVQGSRLRLYATRVDTGIGRRGRTETYIECEPVLLSEKHLAYLWLIYSAEALESNGSLKEILSSSERFAGDLAERLRERIYDRVVPELARGIAAARNIAVPSPTDLERTYQMSLTVLFRLLFIAYAEDRDLLPYRFNDAYRRRSLKQKAQELAEAVLKGTSIAEGDSHYREVCSLWLAVAAGNSEWGVPAYDGGLFSSDPDISPDGAALATISLPNSTFEKALRDLLVIETPEGAPGPVDFRSLGVREFGTIYEGLLESELAVAGEDLALNRKGVYVPVGKQGQVAVPKGAIYIHNRSGVRKSTGSYYTKQFAVDHLLDGALELALDDHLARLNALDDTDASEAFFDFRVADIAMGSGHFLIAAIDRIEKRLADFLADRNLGGVRQELSALRSAALKELGDLSETVTIEDTQLIRRLIARHCIYGVDLNALSVHLARLAVWIHTFVPGLPLSFLDRSLVRGNSLVGVAGINEVRDKFRELSQSLFPIDTESLLGQAATPLRRLANINDATLQDIEDARHATTEAREATAAAEALFDLIAARSISDDLSVANFQFETLTNFSRGLVKSKQARSARQSLVGLNALHFPIAFPEVFLRARPGFDVILGNPPWQEATVEEHAFWARHYPGLRSLSQRDQETTKERLRAERPDLGSLYDAELSATEDVRRALLGGGFPGMGTGDPDLYKAFAWRFWHLVATEGGRIGVVLPRSALAAKGSTAFRRTMFEHAGCVDVTIAVNNREWVFPKVHPQWSIGLVCITRGTPATESIRLRGPFASEDAFARGASKAPSAFTRSEVLSWNDSASLPLLPDEYSVAVFAQIRKSPRLDLNVSGQWRARPDTELHATSDKPLMDLDSIERPEGFWPVYKGESFDLWNPDTGTYYAWANPEPVQKRLQAKRLRAGRGKRDSVHREFPQRYLKDTKTLPCFRARVAFRDVTNRTNQRTVIACLVPPEVLIGNQAPYLLWPRGDELDEAFVLGVLSSLPLDWYARRFVETHVNYFVFNPFPVPRPGRDSALWKQVVSLAGRLACPDERFRAWADAVGAKVGPLPMDEKEDMIYELDAVVAHLYGLDEAQLVHVFETFHEGWDYQNRLDSVLHHFQRIAKAQL